MFYAEEFILYTNVLKLCKSQKIFMITFRGGDYCFPIENLQKKKYPMSVT